ncbi:ketopantoate reductase family protein [Brevibacillus fluminis]|uniref:2-dehydropantoate 2-reductase n=1 Tax=Brevibacillus fluminis TaxID=511487 RepID=A0A3M8DQX7_9BACL|nr:ketopantoate reductase family protein [Brevibacillus fluminis]RNB90482.1 ketopantoate reductase family protein [Brevibacillus fluminis]
MRTAIMGAGSLGTIIGAFLSREGVSVELIDTNVAHVEALNRHGATVNGFTECTVPVIAYTPDQMNGTYDLVLLLTKQTYNQQVLSALLPFLHSDSIVCTLQNGVPEERVAAIVGRERVIGGAVGFGATWNGPGVSQLTTPLETVARYAFEIGELDGSDSSRIRHVQELLGHVGGCHVVFNLLSIKWSKLLINATFSGMSAALGCTFGDVLEDERAMACVAQIADETIKVAHAQDIRLTHMQGKDLEELALAPGETFLVKLPIYRHVFAPHAALKASMLQDLERGLPTEIDWMNGLICQKGRQLGIPTPFNDRVVALVKAAEAAGLRPDTHQNLAKMLGEQW